VQEASADHGADCVAKPGRDQSVDLVRRQAAHLAREARRREQQLRGRHAFKKNNRKCARRKAFIETQKDAGTREAASGEGKTDCGKVSSTHPAVRPE
jgi:hypothetical protein